MSGPAQPIVLLGGAFSVAAVYAGMRDALARISGQAVTVVPTSVLAWSASVLPLGWALILDQLDAAVKPVAAGSPTGKVTLVGHSSGGIMARLYLGEQPFERRVYNGRQYVDTLITLGSPHYNYRGAYMRKLVDRRYPGAYFAPAVRYLAVAGKAVHGRKRGTLGEISAWRAYAQLIKDGESWGDGLVPVDCALLSGAAHLTLEGAHHYSMGGRSWYGAPDVIAQWWQACPESG